MENSISTTSIPLEDLTKRHFHLLKLSAQYRLNLENSTPADSRLMCHLINREFLLFSIDVMEHYPGYTNYFQIPDMLVDKIDSGLLGKYNADKISREFKEPLVSIELNQDFLNQLKEIVEGQ